MKWAKTKEEQNMYLKWGKIATKKKKAKDIERGVRLRMSERIKK